MLSKIVAVVGTVVLFCAASSSAHAITLDWDTVTWTAGNLSASYNIDPARSGNDITVAVAANGGSAFQQELVSPNPMTPAINPSFQGGLASTQNTLCIALNLASNSQTVTVTVTLSSQYTAGVTNVSFKIFDLDYSNATGNTYQDQLTLIRGLSVDGTTLIAPTITTSADNTRTGSGINQVVNGNASTNDTGTGSGDGNVTISFGANAIRSFTFTYGSSSAFANPTYQHIGIYDITFTPVPEINPAWSAVVSCLAVVGLVLRHRSVIRK